MYAITHVASGRVYVGSAKRLQKRAGQHRTDLNSGSHFNTFLQRAWRKYGEGAFTFSVLELVDDPAQLTDREQIFIDSLQATDRRRGFNRRPIAHSNLGLKMLPATRARIAEAQRKVMADPAARERIAAALRGRKATAEQLAKQSASLKAAWARSPFVRPKPTAEHVEKMRIALTGIKRSPEVRAKMAAICSRMSEAQRGIPQSPEHVAKRMASSAATRAARRQAPCLT